MTRGRILLYEADDLHLNLALEQAILQKQPSEYPLTLRIWRNPRSVVLGRSQRIGDEVNLNYCIENGIEVGRRISGGGAVYHDMGNLNISFYLLKGVVKGQRINDKAKIFTEILIQALQMIGYDTKRMGGYTILWRERKVSGSAVYLSRGRLLYHATLLVSANLEHLENSLTQKTMKPNDGRMSQYYPTKNIGDLDMNLFIRKLKELVEERMDMALSEGKITREELDFGLDLQKSLYSKRAWIMYGKRP
jgi:lipoate-protein ligase A